MSLFSKNAPPQAAAPRLRPQVLRVILGMVLRDLQLRAALDPDWIDLEVLESDGLAAGPRRLHARLVMRVWAPRVLAHAAQLERMFVERLCELDADAFRWFGGLSWRLDIPAGQMLDALPAPHEWTAPAPAAPWNPANAGGAQPLRH